MWPNVHHHNVVPTKFTTNSFIFSSIHVFVKTFKVIQITSIYMTSSNDTKIIVLPNQFLILEYIFIPISSIINRN